MSKASRKTRRGTVQKATTGKSRAKAAARKRTMKPVKLTAKKIAPREEEGGPLAWLLPTMESAYTPLAAPSVPVPRAAETRVASTIRPAKKAALVPAAPVFWRELSLEYKRRKAAAVAPPAVRATAVPGAPFVPGARNWLPLGPSVVLQGQTVGQQPVAGRVAGLAVAPGGSVIYAASANGGVFRSHDGATTWRALMDRFDLDPTSFASASLICGAIALDPGDPNRIYVGTGEGDTLQLFRSRITNALPAYRGVGPIRSDDGGVTWIAETSVPDLAGEAFFALALDPSDRDTVVGGTTKGLYRRVRRPGNRFEWISVRNGVHSSVVATAGGGVRRFYAAQWGQPGVPAMSSGVFHSDDGSATWQQSGTGFPTGNVGRVALGAQPGNPNLLYAFATTKTGALNGVYRLDGIAARWRQVANVPNVLPGAQGSYDLAIAVDPNDANLIYLGGDRMTTPPWGGSIWRCTVAPSGIAYRVASAVSIGTHAHADVHFLIHTPGDSDELWTACDGGVFLNRNPRGAGQFGSQNNGLSCLCCNFIGQHPSDPNILFTGLQDNGTARTGSGPLWTHVFGGDGGYCVVNWADPRRVLVFANGTVYRSSTGGTSHAGWSPVWDFGWASMTQPIVGVPINPAAPADARLVALGAGPTVYVSTDFASSWAMTFTLPGGSAAGAVFALAFASRTRLFVATSTGRVFRADRSGNSWTVIRLDDASAGPLAVRGLINDIAVDWADATGRSCYVAFAGMGDRRRVWWFDGTKWAARAGATAATGLLDVEHNALAVDRMAPNNVYVGADIGVWHSADRGMSWKPLQNGLPDAPVFDLQIHPTRRLLRAATHGRGVFEIALS